MEIILAALVAVLLKMQLEQVVLLVEFLLLFWPVQCWSHSLDFECAEAGESTSQVELQL
jgi:hypothetical protein